jgi:hypothetical protein
MAGMTAMMAMMAGTVTSGRRSMSIMTTINARNHSASAGRFIPVIVS